MLADVCVFDFSYSEGIVWIDSNAVGGLIGWFSRFVSNTRVVKVSLWGASQIRFIGT